MESWLSNSDVQEQLLADERLMLVLLVVRSINELFRTKYVENRG